MCNGLGMREVEIDAVPLERLARLLEPERAARLATYEAQGRSMLEGRVVWNVNATATGGGVAEMLLALLSYSRGAGVDARWLVLDGTPEFFRITKRVHNLIHGSPGDGGPLGDTERATYESVLSDNLEPLLSRVSPGDLVLLHDPQTAGLAAGLRRAGAHVVWRCHVGRDTSTELTDRAWAFLRPYVEDADGAIFSRPAYVPPWLDTGRVWIIPPSLDPFTAKNVDLSPREVGAILQRTGLVSTHRDGGTATFPRRDGSTGTVRPHSGLITGGQVVPGAARLVLQVSRWDRLKDMSGVLTAFSDHLALFPEDAHLMLVGPDVFGVSDDPEGAEVLAECLEIWHRQPPAARLRLHLCSLPMDDVDENAALVNALQRHAEVVVQKSLVEGFGLTVTEPMWKARPVLASRIGGIQDQIVHGASGLLLDDPADLDGFAHQLASMLADPDLARGLGTAARERVRDQFLGDRHLIQYVDLFGQLITR